VATIAADVYLTAAKRDGRWAVGWVLGGGVALVARNYTPLQSPPPPLSPRFLALLQCKVDPRLKKHLNVRYKRLQPQTHREIPLENRDPNTQVMKIESICLGSIGINRLKL